MIDLLALSQQCAPNVAPSTLQAIIRTESGFNPLALHVNGPVRLQRPPKSAAEAAAWSSWLIGRGYSVDMGLMQINSRNLTRLNLTSAEAFEPCQNVRAGAAILTAEYGQAAQTHGIGTQALLHAISAYNTGNFEGGFHNGYVLRVMMHASSARSLSAPAQLPTHCSSRSANAGHCAHSSQPYTVDSAVRGFDRQP